MVPPDIRFSRLMLLVKIRITEYRVSNVVKLNLLVSIQYNIWALTGSRSRKSAPNAPGGWDTYTY